MVAPLDREGGGEVLGEGLDAEALGGVVSRGEEVNPELLRGCGIRLFRLTGERA